jgi:hypothetical protein
VLGQIARAHPEARLSGIDLYPEQIATARRHLADLGREAVELVVGDGARPTGCVGTFLRLPASVHQPRTAGLAGGGGEPRSSRADRNRSRSLRPTPGTGRRQREHLRLPGPGPGRPARGSTGVRFVAAILSCAPAKIRSCPPAPRRSGRSRLRWW